MTPRQRATAYEMLERLEQVAYDVADEVGQFPNINRSVRKLADAIESAAKALREALPEPNEPDQW